MSSHDIFELPSEEVDSAYFKNLLLKYLRYWYLFVIGAVLGLGIAFIYLRYTTPMYYISSALLIKDDKKGPDLSGNAVFSDLDIFNSTKNIDNEIQVLKSISLMQRVLTELSLQTSYFVEGRVNDVEVYGADLPVKIIIKELKPQAYNKTIAIQIKTNNRFELDEFNETGATSYHLFGQEIKRPYGTFTVVAGSLDNFNDRRIFVQFHDLRKLAEHYSGQLTVNPVNKNASVLTLGLIDAVKEKGADIINKLTEVYNKEALEDKNAMASNTIQFIDERLLYLTSELTDVEKEVEQYKRQNRVADVTVQAQQYLEQANGYQQRLTDWGIQIDVLESIEKYLSRQEDKYALVPSTLGIEDATLIGLISRYNELQSERERLLESVQPANPLLLNMDKQLNNLRTNILENLRNIKKGITITRNKLQASSGMFQNRIQQVPAIERRLLEINRQQGIKQELYLYLLQKREESALSLAAAVSNSRIIDPAIASDNAVKPKKTLTYLLSFILGISLPLAGVYIKDLFNDKVQGLKDIEKATAMPILGEIFHNNTGNTLVVTEKSRTPISEIFRLIRSNLRFATVGKENKVIMVTSSISGEGKTFFSVNLAASLALTGKSVIMVEFDLRKPNLLHELGVSYTNGITNYLVSNIITVDDMVKPYKDMPGLYVIGAGQIPPNPAELMISPKVGLLIDELKENFDYIIIDTAPLGMVADAFALAQYIDSTIYLVRSNFTHKAHLNMINTIYKDKKINHPTIILNDVKINRTNGYGYGYSDSNNRKISTTGSLASAKRKILNKL